MRISFILPGPGVRPIGGYKVVYEYCNHLAKRGHSVSVIHPARLQQGFAARSFGSYLYRKLTREYVPKEWFALDPEVRVYWVPSLAARYIPNGDAVIATSWETAEWVAQYPAAKGRGAYLIQQVETWSGPEHRVMATWKLPLKKLVIADWLMQVARTVGEEAWYLPNGLDFSQFQMKNAPEDRDRYKAMMLYHELENKGSGDGLQAFYLVQKKMPELRLTLFGVPEPPHGLPSEIQYHRLPSQRFLCDLYNSHAIFVAPSWTEGWALPPAEAMMCGGALVATDIGGHRGYAMDQQTALLSPVRDVQALAENIERMVRDEGLRTRIARAGHEFVQQFRWERSASELEHYLFEG